MPQWGAAPLVIQWSLETIHLVIQLSPNPIIGLAQLCTPISGCKNLWGTKWTTPHKIANKKVKIENGNGKLSLKILHCNFGPHFWANKIEDIENLVNTQKHDLLFVSEAKIYLSDPDYTTRIEGYDLHPFKMLQTHGYTRLALLAKPDLNIKLVENWMGVDTAEIWVYLKRKGQKIINIGGGVYREHCLLLQQDELSATDTAQNRRWDLITNNWVKAGNKMQCFLIGYFESGLFTVGQP